ncbi:4-hydroxy-3-methylbut-2-enyl diphosphate reductase, partial [Haemophilus influenzae]
NARK